MLTSLMLLQFLVALGLLSLALGAILGLAGIWAFLKYRKNGALFLGTTLVITGVIVLSIAHHLSAAV
ncbi:MAG: hypothetical protein ACSHYF_02105 [Verrucomicrobiaceae bacterium]